MTSIEVTLVTGRSLAQGIALEKGKLSEDYLKNVAVVELDENDLRRLGISEGDTVKVKTKFGEVVVKAIKSREPHPGIAFIPMGPWASLVVDPSTEGSGMPTLKGIHAEISPTKEPVMNPVEILRRVYNLTKKIPPMDPAEVVVVKEETKRIEKHVTCAFCGSLCDDLEVVISGGRIIDVRKACALGRSKILHAHENRILSAYIRKNGELVKADLKEAIRHAAKILVNADYPLLYGWSSTSVEAIKLGLELAEILGGAFDNTSVICHGPSIQALQEVGLVTCTLGQVKNYADLIIYWGCNPLHAHPRHLARYTVLSRGVYVKSRKERKFVVVDVRQTSTARAADLFIKVRPNEDYELLSALRMIIKGFDIEASEVAGVPIEKIYELADMMMSAKFGVIFYGLGLTMTKGKSRNIEEVIKLVQELNEWTKFVLIPMRGHYNVTGANQVCAWTTGYPYSIDFRRGYPRHIPGLTSAPDLLANGDVDAVLIVASDPVAHFPNEAVRHMLKIPLITIDPKWSLTATVSDVVIPSAIVGLECEGTAYRMDAVPIRLRKLIEPPPGVLSDEEILRMLLDEVKKLKGIGGS